MRQSAALLVAALALLGCQAPGQAVDPFFGRTTVDPPPTGAVAGTVPQAYYPGAAARRRRGRPPL